MNDQMPIIKRREENLFFVHNCFGSFFRGVLDWIDDKVYPKFNMTVIGTYDKAVEYFNKKKELNREGEVKITPCITLDPMYDFSNEERGGRFLWQFQRYAPGIGMRMSKSIDLKEQDVLVTPVFSRYQGTFEVIMWLNSVYELMDLRVTMLQLCGGFGRWLRPEFFWSYMIFPERIENFEDENGTKLDWGNTYAEFIHVSTINKHRLAIPFALDAMWKLDSFNDASTKFGGDRLSEQKMSATFSYEVNLPTYMVLSNKVEPQLKLSFSLGNTFTKYPLASPHRILTLITNDGKPELDKIVSRNFMTYKITDSEAERTNRIVQLSNSCLRYPLVAMKWNHIVSGRLIVLDNVDVDDPNFKVEKGDIIYMETYQDKYLPLLRRCSAAINQKDTKVSKYYGKCVALNKPMVCFLTDQEAAIIKSYDGQTITLDPFRRMVYSGALASDIAAEDPEAAYEILKEVKLAYPELYEDALKKLNKFEDVIPDNYAQETVSELTNRLISDNTDGITKTFTLGYKLDVNSLASLKVYIEDNLVNRNDYQIDNYDTITFNEAPYRGSKVYIGGELLVIKDSKLVGIYEYTEEDTALASIELDLPRKLDRLDGMTLVSYIGKLVADRDYTVNFIDQSIKILIKPKLGEIVQFFYYI